MGLDRNKALLSAERLLKQGKVQAALGELERVAVSAPGDLLTLNRMGDLLARQGRNEEAAEYYSKIASQFTSQGFYPKAVAIRKKILRLDPKSPRQLVELADLYVKQKLPGEARRYYLLAADQHLEKSEFTHAREIYERLLAAEPDDPRHRVRVAEARAAEGETDRAGEELLNLADVLFRSGQPADAERSYRRAGELLPARVEPLLGIANCLTERGLPDEAIELLESRAAEDGADPQVLGELLLRFEQQSRFDDSAKLLERMRAREIPAPQFVKIFRMHLGREQTDQLWERLDSVFRGWCEEGCLKRMAGLYSELGEIEEGGHIPALRRLYDLQRSIGDRNLTTQAIERLARALRAAGREDEARPLLAELREMAPRSPLLIELAREAEPPIPGVTPAVELADEAYSLDSEMMVEAEAPAVPLDRSDEEFVAGRLTQAEILEKYGLRDQAREQILEVIDRFPGHENAQRKLVALSRVASDKSALAKALFGLALAARASGNLEEASSSAVEAAQLGSLEPKAEGMLRRIGLLSGVAPRKVARAPEVAPEPRQGPAKQAPARQGRHDDGGIVIDFEAGEPELPAEVPLSPQTSPLADEDELVVVSPPTAESTGSGPRVPGAEMLEEIRLYLDRGLIQEAQHRVDALRALGYGGEALDGVALSVGEVSRRRQAAEFESKRPGPPAMMDPLEGIEDDDLSSITAALEGELFSDVAETLSQEKEASQSLEEVFAAFKQRVDAEVEHDDYRTHYDLGIAYKEMGLQEEAVQAFILASESPELFREACTMVAVCLADGGRAEEAAEWYRKAIDAPGSDLETRAGLCYDLANLLLSHGDRAGALDLLRDVQQSNPAFRDVQQKVAELESV